MRLFCLLVGRPCARPHCHQARADGAVKQREPPATCHNDSRTPTLLDRRRPGRATRAQPSADPRKQHKRHF
ncbi:MAG: hypothetical protein LC790_19900, partial [Actinobacteria bacterium]|nr:hypothetical protein [Actinomycetota bacterium]